MNKDCPSNGLITKPAGISSKSTFMREARPDKSIINCFSEVFGSRQRAIGKPSDRAVFQRF